MKRLFHTIIATMTAFAAAIWDLNIANTAVWLSGASYCGMENYKTMQLGGPATNFQVTNVLYDEETDLQGYIGLLKSTRMMYVVFRGSSSRLNWRADFEIIRRDYDTYPECECSVHTGFYKATENLKDETIYAVSNLKRETGYKTVIVTGHSLGAAVAQLMGMELTAVDIYNEVYNYGQPRIGNNKYAEFVNKIMKSLYRFTHDRDMVPHIPPRDVGYLHSCREIFEDKMGKLKECSSVECEDPECADQYRLSQTNTDDHSYYLGHFLDCANSTRAYSL
jgi:Lipase (class 3)